MGVRRYFRSELISWEWSDPWVRITAALAVSSAGLFLACLLWDVPKIYLWVAFWFVLAAASRRNELYLRRTGRRPDIKNMFREFWIVCVVILAFILIVYTCKLLGL